MRRRSLVIAAVLGAAVVAAVALALLSSRDGGSARPSTAEWADSVCTSLAAWRSSITLLADVGDGALTAESLRTKLEGARAATRRLGAELRGLDAPELEAGGEVEEALDDVAAGLERSFASLSGAAEEAAEAGTQGEFLAALARLGDDFQRLLDDIADSVAVFRSASLFGESSAELEQAFAEADSCQEFRIPS